MTRIETQDLSADELEESRHPIPERAFGIACVVIQIEGSTRPIWRRLLIDETTPVADLSEIARVAMGWSTNAAYASPTSTETPTSRRTQRTRRRRKRPLPLDYPFTFRLAGWIHTVTVEARVAREEASYPLCLEGEGDRPSARGRQSDGRGSKKKRGSILFDTTDDLVQIHAVEANKRFRAHDNLSDLETPTAVDCQKQPN